MTEVTKAEVLAHLDPQPGEPAQGYIGATDVKDALADLWDNAHEALLNGGGGGGSFDSTLYYTKAQTDTALALKATVTALALKADSTAVTSGLALKADAAAMATALGLKADTSALAAKADTSTLALYYLKTESDLRYQAKSTINVKEGPYNAVGDGIVNDTAAIQAAIDASSPGDVVYFPAGTYLVSAMIRLRTGRAYRGAVNGFSVIVQGAGQNLSAVLGCQEWSDNNATPASNILVTDLGVDGSKSTNSGTTAGFLMYGTRIILLRCRAVNTDGDGIRYTDRCLNGTTLAVGPMPGNRIIDCLVQTPDGNGIVVDDYTTGSQTDGFLINNEVQGAAQHAIWVKRSTGWLVQGNHTATLSGVGFSGIWCQGAFATKVLANYVDRFGESATTGFYTGIPVDQGAVRGSIVAHNYVAATSSPVSGTTYRGIHVICGASVATPIVVVNGNQYYGNLASGENGIRFEAGAGSVLIVQSQANHVEHSLSPYVHQAGAGTVKIEGGRSTFSDADATITIEAILAQVGTMSAPRTVTLPLASSAAPGRRITIIDESGSVTGTNLISVARAGSDLINGVTTPVTVVAAYGALTLYSDGATRWTTA